MGLMMVCYDGGDLKTPDSGYYTEKSESDEVQRKKIKINVCI